MLMTVLCLTRIGGRVNSRAIRSPGFAIRPNIIGKKIFTAKTRRKNFASLSFSAPLR